MCMYLVRFNDDSLDRRIQFDELWRVKANDMLFVGGGVSPQKVLCFVIMSIVHVLSS